MQERAIDRREVERRQKKSDDRKREMQAKLVVTLLKAHTPKSITTHTSHFPHGTVHTASTESLSVKTTV